MKIITGRTGTQHVASADDRAFNNAVFGNDGFIGVTPEAKMIDANTIRIMPCEIMFQGCHARILPGNYEDLRISSGTAGYKRIDLVVARYTMSENGIEDMSLKVVRGTPVNGTPEIPTHITGNLYTGALEAELPLYTVKIDGINVGEPTLVAAFLASLESLTVASDALSNEVESTREDLYKEINSVAGTANDAAGAAAGAQASADDARKAAQNAQESADAALVKANDAKTSATEAAKIAATGRVILGTQRHTFKFTESGGGVTVGDTDIFTFNAPTGTNGVFGVVKTLSKLCEFLSYSYTLEEDGTCTFTVNGLNSATSQGSIEMVIICIGPASQGITS